MKNVKKAAVCPAQLMMNTLSKKHMLSLIYSLSQEAKGFNALQQELGINTATLTSRLHELEDRDLVEMRTCTKDARHHYYSLTKRGLKLSALIGQFSRI